MDPIYFDQHYRRTPELWQDMVLNLCRGKGLPSGDFQPFLAGSNLIAAVGGSHVIKIFPQWLRHQWESDTLILRHLEGRLRVPTPRCLDAGDLDKDWKYIVMDKLPGEMLEDYWPAMTKANKAGVMNAIGRLMAEVKELPVDGLEGLQPEWSGFIKAQLEHYQMRHQKHGMPAWFMNQVEDYVNHRLHLLPKSFRPILLTGEYTPFNLLAEQQDGEVRISGMIDFGDAMVGYADYDLLGPSLFLGEGSRDLIAQLFEGYGTKVPRPLLMLLQILHRYSDFKAQLRIPDWEVQEQSIEELEELIWPI